MSEFITRTARLVPYAKRPKQVPSFVTAYSYNPLADQPRAELGGMYVIMEVLVSGRASEEVADLIIETVGDQYYNQPHDNPQPLARFEAAIKAVNQELGEHVNHGNAAWIGKLSAVIAIQTGAELHVAQTGSAEAFLYRGKSSTHITSGSDSRPATPAKTFGSIATGELEPGDRLLLATPALTHQIPLTKLQSVISSSSPNGAISEITKLLDGATTERIAGLIIEITTPELAALQVRSEEPDEIQLAVAQNPIEAAKFAAAPLTQSTVAGSKKLAHAAHLGWKHAQPHARSAGLALAAGIRQILGTRTGRWLGLAGLALGATTLVVLAWHQRSAAATTKLFGSYQAVYADVQHAQTLLDNGQSSDARSALTAAQHQLDNLRPHQTEIDQQLKHRALPESEPRSFHGLGLLIGDRLDQIDSLVKTDVETVATFTTKVARPGHFELVGTTAYVLDETTNNLSIVSVTTNAVRASKADFSKLGDVKDTTISAANDGIYLLTSKPSVWFYRFDTDTLAEQTIAFGEWPKATAIASYASNLYLLDSSTVYKHVRNATGFSPKTTYLSLPQPSTGLAVDGYVYTGTEGHLLRYLAGALNRSATAPQGLGAIQSLRSTSNGGIIIGASPTTHRIGLWIAKDDQLSFDKQIAPNHISTLYDAAYDAKSSTIYATVDNRLVRFRFRP